MKQLGIKLKEYRIKLNYSLDQVSKITKTNKDILEAIESGDIDFFQDDLKYLLFYIKGYANCVGLNYKDYEKELLDSLDLFSETKTIQLELEKQILNENIKKRAKIYTNNNIKKIKSYDFSTLSLIVVIILIIALVLFGILLLDKDKLNDNSNNINILEIFNPNQNLSDVNNDILINKKDQNNYIIEVVDTNQVIDIDIKFGQRTWLRFYLNDQILNNPISKIYNKDENLNYQYNYIKNDILTIHLGIFNDNTIYINDKSLEIDDGILSSKSSDKLNLIFKEKKE